MTDKMPNPWGTEPTVPDGDNAIVSQHMAMSTVNKLGGALREIVTMVEVHEDMAPKTAGLITELCSIVAGELLAWVRRWPR